LIIYWSLCDRFEIQWILFNISKEIKMRLPVFEYIEPTSLKEAANALTSPDVESVLLAGGTDLLVNMKYRVSQPRRVANLKNIPRLAYISDGKNGIRVGPMTTRHDLASSSIIKQKYPVLSQAGREVGLTLTKSWELWVGTSVREIGASITTKRRLGDTNPSWIR
jgi:xanthine dehydrogenase iron-sulfur cluster and FAD-binding subunit A